MRFEGIILAGLLIFFGTHAAKAEQTEIVVRVIAKDAKFIGTETGGAQITLRDADSGEILAQGLTAGGTGSTPRIMTDGHARRNALSDEAAAKFTASIDLQRPRRITVTATGPMILKDAAMTASSTQWVLPGKSITGGDGWVLELPGFAITFIEPPPANVQLGGKDAKVPLKAKITMQCGCPITPGGIWDANKLQIAAVLERGAKTYPPTPLVYAGQPSTFGGDIPITEPGKYTAYVYAYDPSNGNTGLVKFALTAQ
jgi:hypothetical protein